MSPSLARAAAVHRTAAAPNDRAGVAQKLACNGDFAERGS
jgi:hypothetical protein